jgi:hypothetical protein
MQVLKVMTLAFLSVVLFLAACEKDDIAPVAEEANSNEMAVNKATTNDSNEKQTVNISIVGDRGTILSSTKVEIKEGNTVLDVTLSILKQKGIPISVRGSGSSAYVEGIDNLFEFDHGPLSGWTAKRNDTILDQSSDAIQVKNGDTIQWIYTSNDKEDGR